MQNLNLYDFLLYYNVIVNNQNMKVKDLDNKEIKLELSVDFAIDQIKDEILARIDENEEFTEDSLKEFIKSQIIDIDLWIGFLNEAKLTIKDK